MQIEIKINASEFEGAMAKLLGTLKDTSQIRKSIGETILRSTDDRIRSSGPAPDGTPWQPLSPAYLLVKKNKGKMLIESGELRNALVYQLLGKDSVVVGVEPSVKYARIHQLGGVIKHKPHTREIRLRTVKGKTRFAKKSHKNARSVLANLPTRTTTIPARPYLGISKSDEEAIKNIVEDHIKRGWGNR